MTRQFLRKEQEVYLHFELYRIFLGSLTERLKRKYYLTDGKDPQTYGIGLKEIWEVKPENFVPGLVQHTVGWPVEKEVYAGSFMYHMEPNLVHFGYVVGLDYKNPYLNPYEEFQVCFINRKKE